MRFVCEHCGDWADRPAGHVNRSRAKGMGLYCGRICMGLARRKHKPKAQRVEEKRLYDTAYRQKNADRLKAQKAAYNKRTYDPVKAAEHRKTRMPQHVEYCRRPEYRVKKRIYDKARRACEYGPAAEAWLLLTDLDREIRGRMDDYEIRKANLTLNKKQTRCRQEACERARGRDRAA